MKPRLWFLAVAAAAALVLAGCAGDEQAKPKEPTKDAIEASFVGAVDDSDANIGLVVKDGRLAGFVCQDEQASLKLAPVATSEGAATLEGPDGATVGSVNLTEESATGTIKFEGASHTFTAEKATGDAGVYRLGAEDGDDWTGWVVLNDGTYTGNAKGKPSSGRPWVDPEPVP